APASDAAGVSGGPGLALWPLSARDADAVPGQAERLSGWLADRAPEERLGDVGRSLGTTRSMFPHRAVVVGADLDDMRSALAAVASGESDPRVVRGVAVRGRTAFLFAGQGSQRPGMGRELYDTFPAFAAAFDAVDAELPFALREVVFGTDAERLNRTEFAQPALFALEVALFRLLESWGVRPDALAGHSIGEIAAAHVASVWSLADACRLVVARGRLMQALPEGGAMVAVEAAEDEVLPLPLDGRVGLAAVNGPRSVVVSGAADAVEDVVAPFREEGRKVTALRVSHAFHSPMMDPMLARFRAVAESLTYRSPSLPVVSTVTGRAATAGELTTPEYWVEHVRRPVRFADAVRGLKGLGAVRHLELGPDATLSGLARGVLEETPAVVVPALRREGSETRSVLRSVGTLHTAGHSPDWSALHPGARRVDLPTYAFLQRRLWLDPLPGRSRGVGHALLGSALTLADSTAVVSTTHLSARTHPWLADHTVAGRTVLPTAAYLDFALHLGGRVGCDHVVRLDQERPLVLDGDRAAEIQVVLDAPAADGSRPFACHARTADDQPWTRHAHGLLAPATGTPEEPQEDDGAWPPPGAQALDDDEIDALHETARLHGLDRGPAFRALTAVWRAGNEAYAEVAVPEELSADALRVALHPALLDAALHASPVLGHPGQTPVTWRDVTLYAAAPDVLRVRLRPGPGGEIRLDLADESGAPVASVGAVTLAPVADLALTGPAASDLFTVEWAELPAAPRPASPPTVAFVGADPAAGPATGEGAPGDVPDGTRHHPDLDALLATGGTVPDLVLLTVHTDGAELPAALHTATATALDTIQRWLADERTRDARLVLVTRGAVAVRHGDPVTDPAAAAVRGLVRSAQSESPGRFLLVDLDGDTDPETALAALPADESEIAVRAGRAYAARLVRHRPTAVPDVPALDPLRTVLITGAGGTVAAAVARHLVTAHGVRSLLLASRRGPDAPGTAELRADLEAHGARVTFAACDVADPDALGALLDGLPPEHPLGAVFHAAGVLDDGVLTALTPDRLSAVLRPKADAAVHLERLTRDLDLSAFVLFSSAAATFGGPGQGNYAAANAFLDAYATALRGRGRRATALGWGLWAEDGGMTADLSDTDRDRAARAGVGALPTPDALALLDLALTQDRAVLLPVRLDLTAARTATSVPPLLRDPAATARRTARPGTRLDARSGGRLAGELAALPAAERTAALLRLLRTEIATVLGHPAGAPPADAERPFRDLGFDSLTAVELRN
ncbi:type I polyketide synthase, partial [Streptomyces corynorhini]